MESRFSNVESRFINPLNISGAPQKPDLDEYVTVSCLGGVAYRILIIVFRILDLYIYMRCFIYTRCDQQRPHPVFLASLRLPPRIERPAKTV
jgi:hypothetical protein